LMLIGFCIKHPSGLVASLPFIFDQDGLTVYWINLIIYSLMIFLIVFVMMVSL